MGLGTYGASFSALSGPLRELDACRSLGAISFPLLHTLPLILIRPKLLQSPTLLRTHSVTQHGACSVSCTLACLQNTQNPAHEAAVHYFGSYSSCTTCQPLHPHHSTMFSKSCAPAPHMHLQSAVEWAKLGRFAKFLFLRDQKEHAIMKNGFSKRPNIAKVTAQNVAQRFYPNLGTCLNTLRGPNQVLMVTMGAYGPPHLCCTKMAHASNHSCPKKS